MVALTQNYLNGKMVTIKKNSLEYMGQSIQEWTK